MLTSPKSTDPSPATLDDGRQPLDGIDHLDSGQPIKGIFEPPSSFAWAAIVRNKLIVGLCALLVALAGAAYGLTRKKVYTASATLQIGQVNPNSPGFFGYEQSAASLASSFSRAIGAQAVLDTIQHKLKLAPSVAVARLSSEPLPVTPAFRVIGTGPSEAAALRLTNVAAAAVIEYESKSNSSNPQAATLLHEYRDASVVLRNDVAKLAELSHARKHTPEPVLADAEAERSAAQVKLKAITQAYVGAVTSEAPRAGLVSLIAGATSASADQSSKVELDGLVGLLAGVVVGCMAAVLAERLRLARRRAAMRKIELPRSEAPRSEPA